MSKQLRTPKLAHDIATALFRVSALVRHERLRRELEEAAVELVKDVYPKSVDTLERLVRFSEAVGEVSEINAGVLCRELGNLRNMLNTEISESISGVANQLDLREIFVEKASIRGDGEPQEIKSQEKRQEAILDYIRKFPNGCRMRQLSATFADFSERTVRADIQRLMDKGLVEKIGSKTGPFSYFRSVDVDSSAFQPDEVILPVEPL